MYICLVEINLLEKKNLYIYLSVMHVSHWHSSTMGIPIIGFVTLVAITGATKQVPTHLVNTLQLI